jgi:hypothetical protein
VSHEIARAFCRAVLTAFPGTKITKRPLSPGAVAAQGAQHERAQ